MLFLVLVEQVKLLLSKHVIVPQVLKQYSQCMQTSFIEAAI